MFGRKKKDAQKEKKAFVDLNDYKAPMHAQSDAKIKVVEVLSHRDLKAVTDMAYRGNIMVLDFSRFADDDSVKRDMARRLLEIAVDLEGSFTEVSGSLMILSPSGLSIDKLRITYRE